MKNIEADREWKLLRQTMSKLSRQAKCPDGLSASRIWELRTTLEKYLQEEKEKGGE